MHGNQLAGERLACIYKIIQAQKHISEDSISNGKTDGIQPENKNAAGLTVVTTIDGCADLLVPLEKYKNATISFEKGQVLDLEALSKDWYRLAMSDVRLWTDRANLRCAAVLSTFSRIRKKHRCALSCGR